jgi:hypothetical protein
MGSELYAYFRVQGQTQSGDLAELAEDSGMSDLPGGEDTSQVVARLSPDSDIEQGGDAELVLETAKLQLFDADGRARA